eukprot:scaffold1762_cov383-Prasinococcus_capsulatus_cf.AAC.1
MTSVSGAGDNEGAGGAIMLRIRNGSHSRMVLGPLWDFRGAFSGYHPGTPSHANPAGPDGRLLPVGSGSFGARGVAPPTLGGTARSTAVAQDAS